MSRRLPPYLFGLFAHPSGIWIAVCPAHCVLDGAELGWQERRA